jgi:hypothetical protein
VQASAPQAQPITRTPWIILGIFLAILLAGPLAAAAPPIQLTGSLSLPIPIQDLELVAPPSNPADESTCRTSFATRQNETRSITFSEGPNVAGCLSVRYNFTVPGGTYAVQLQFQADRVMTHGAELVSVIPPAFVQQLRLWDQQTLVYSREYFGHTNQSQPVQLITAAIDRLPPTSLSIEWWFANHANPPGSSTQGWTSTITAPSLRFDAIPLPSPRLVTTGGAVQETGYASRYRTEIYVPTQFAEAAAGGHFAIRAHLPGDSLLDRILSPQGNPLVDDEYGMFFVNDERILTLPGSTLADFGPGPYTLTFQTEDPFAVRTPMAGLAFLALTMPAIGILLALKQLRQRTLDGVLGAAEGLEDELGQK